MVFTSSYLTTVQGDIISRYLFGKSLGLVTSPDFIERAEQMRSFTKEIWVAIHFQFIRNTLLALPRWLIAYLSNAWVKVLWVRYYHPICVFVCAPNRGIA